MQQGEPVRPTEYEPLPEWEEGALIARSVAVWMALISFMVGCARLCYDEGKAKLRAVWVRASTGGDIQRNTIPIRMMPQPYEAFERTHIRII